MPVQLPVCCLSPVSALNTVDFPTFGLPAKATVTLMAVPPFLRKSGCHPVSTQIRAAAAFRRATLMSRKR